MSTTKAEVIAMFEAYNQTLSLGTQRNPGRCQTPRQIVASIFECLVILTADIPALPGLCEELRTAYVLNRPFRPGQVLNDEWREVEATISACSDVWAALNVRDTTAAWRAAASASSYYRAAEDQLLLERERLKTKASAAMHLAVAQKKGAETNRAKRDSRRQEAIKIYQKRAWDSRDDAITAIAKQMDLGLTTVRKYLRRATTS